jgi:hypothetical protein
LAAWAKALPATTEPPASLSNRFDNKIQKLGQPTSCLSVTAIAFLEPGFCVVIALGL